MSYQDHLKTCSNCNKNNKDRQKPTVWIKSASSYQRKRKLSELASIIGGVSYPGISYIGTKAGGTRSAEEAKTNAKGASGSKPDYLERKFKLKELGKLIRG